MNKLALMDKAMLDQGVANASSDVKQANFLNPKPSGMLTWQGGRIKKEEREMVKRCKDCGYYPQDCGYWDMKQRKKENATYVTEQTKHNCADFKK